MIAFAQLFLIYETIVSLMPGNELFRFMVIRPLQKTDLTETTNPILIDFDSVFKKSLIEITPTDGVIRPESISLETIRRQADNYIKTLMWIKKGQELTTKLLDISKEVLPNTRLTSAEIISKVTEHTGTINLEVFVTSAEFAIDKVRILDNYLAALTATESLTVIRKKLAHLIRITTLLELLVKNDQIKRGKIKNILSQTLLLPPEIFPLPLSDERVDDDVIDNSDEDIEKFESDKEKLSNLEHAAEQVEKAYEKNHMIGIRNTFDQRIDTPSMFRWPWQKEDGAILSDKSESVQNVGILSADSTKDLESDEKTMTTLKELKIEKPVNNLISDSKQKSGWLDGAHVMRTIDAAIAAKSKDILSASEVNAKRISYSSSGVSWYDPYHKPVISIDLTKKKKTEKDADDVARGNVSILGVSDLLVVRQKTLRYEYGEIAHVENILNGEVKTRVHRRLNRTEEFSSTTSEKIEEEERDLESTSRFSLEKESSKVIEKEKTMEGHVDVTASYGTTISVELNAGGSISSSEAKSQSEKTAKSFTNDVVERAANRIKESIKEEQTKKLVQEIEETNTHSLKGEEAGGTVGIYRWLNKIEEATIFNYGKRLMLEFLIPEPAHFLKHWMMHQSPSGITAIDPGEFTLIPDDVTVGNYDTLAAGYRVSDINPPPAPIHIVTKSIKFEKDDGTGGSHKWDAIDTEVEIPYGYLPRWTNFAATWNFIPYNGGVPPLERLFITMDGKNHIIWTNTDGSPRRYRIPLEYREKDSDKINTVSTDARGQTTQETLTIGTRAMTIAPLIVVFSIECQRTKRAMEAWKENTLEKLREGYDRLKARYEEQIAASAVQAGVNIGGRNPLQNRRIEKDEIQKHAISIITGNRYNKIGSIIDGSTKDSSKFPEIQLKKSVIEGKYIKFWQQCLEWDNMTYTSFPYFWTKKDKWLEMLGVDDIDPVHANFLKAGYIRVSVPVRRTFECAILEYMETGTKVWDLPEIERDPKNDTRGLLEGCDFANPGTVSIIEEKFEELGVDFDDEKPILENEPVEIIIPTSLILLHGHVNDIPNLEEEQTSDN